MDPTAPYEREPYMPDALYASAGSPLGTPPAYTAPPPTTTATYPEARPAPAAVADAPAWSPRRWASDRVDLLQYAFWAGLAGGVLILLGAFAISLFLMAMTLFGVTPASWWVFDVDGPGDGDGRADWFPGMAVAVAIWGLLTGGMVLLGAVRLKEGGRVTALPGVVMLMGGLLSFFALGGFLLGGIIAILGGVLAIAGASTVFGERRVGRPA